MSRYVITGTNRGIGLEFVKQLLAQGHDVVANARDPDAVPALQTLSRQHKPQLTLMPLDLSIESGIQAFARTVAQQPVDVLINNAGVYGPRDAELGKLRGRDWSDVLWVDVIAPMLLTQALLPALRQGTDKRIAFLSSKMGSIADNSSGGSYVYRSAKTALNQTVKSLAIDLQNEGFVVLPLHPGWVQTDMGGPGALIDTQTSVSGLLKLIQECPTADSGKFFAYNGQPIPW